MPGRGRARVAGSPPRRAPASAPGLRRGRLYFHVVFTLPAALAEIALHNKATVYAILFRAAAETLCTIAADRRHLGAEIGILAVLHTWGQNLHQNLHQNPHS